ncbi:AMP-binding protein [Ramlibacter sp.]|uniref:AMP-binding protein n=1 Tax=Ramlibacter sp. TaxID=1917967 RepID=UPI002FC73EB5
MNASPKRAAAAIEGAAYALGHDELQACADHLAASLRAAGVRVLATLLDNSPAWIVADRAAQAAGLVHVPLPLFFTRAQVQHVLQAAGVDALLTQPGRPAAGSPISTQPLAVAGETLDLLRLPARPVDLPPGTCKITFTSGTTGTPKGVCLDAAALAAVAQGVVQALQPLRLQRHLCALPFPVLLENVAGVMAPLANGGTCIALPLARLGLGGATRFDPALFHSAVQERRPDSLILLPQMLRGWAGWLRDTGQRPPASLRFVAVGGAAVGGRLLQAARACGIPAYEGYGLSEGASVQTLNRPGADRPGSAGQPLPHARVRIAADGEVEVAGALFGGYLGAARPQGGWWRTGDLGSLDADGFLHLRGRRSNVLITAFGRNVSPEWVEGALQEQPGIAAAVVFGDAQPQLCAVLWPAQEGATAQVLQRAVDAANAALPDYARVARWVPALGAFSPETGFATPNGRPCRPAILQAHAGALQLPIDSPATTP